MSSIYECIQLGISTTPSGGGQFLYVGLTKGEDCWGMTSFAPLTGTTLKYQPTHNVNTGKYTSVGLEVDGRGELNSNDCSMTCKNQDK